MITIRAPGEHAPPHQIKLARALIQLEIQEANAAREKRVETARIPPRFRRAHGLVDRAASMIARRGS